MSNVYDVMKLLNMTENVEQIQKKFKLAGASTDVKIRRQTVRSTGLLMSDLMLNGGIYPAGWYTFFGPEQSAKSTLQMSVASSIASTDIPLIAHYDAEGSMTPDYLESILNNMLRSTKTELDVHHMLGMKKPNSKDWLIEPRMRYYPENGLERIWQSISAVLRNLPDKVYTEGKWWLLFSRTKENISRFKAGSKYSGLVNKDLGERYNVIAVEAGDEGTPQALFLVDSYPAMVPESEEDDEGDNSLAIQARAHAKYARLVRGKLRRKHSIVIGVNQLRLRPMSQYNPEYEPCGEYLKFASDVRVSQRALSVPHGTGQFEEEDSVISKGKDLYRYIRMRTGKNKFGSPNIEAWFRIWTSDHIGNAMGFCPVYDTWKYLQETNQVDGTMGRKFSISPNILEGNIKPMKWLDLKKIILLEGTALKEHCKTLGITKKPNVRKKCFDQIKSGEGHELYYESIANK